MIFQPSLLALTLALPVTPSEEAPSSAEVVLDLVVRDKKDTPVLDLRAEEVAVVEDGAKQVVTALRRVALDPAAGVDSAHVVVLLFPRLQDAEGERAQRAAEELVRKQLPPGVRVAVVNTGTDLGPVQDYTADPAALKDAVKRALGPAARSGKASVESLLSLVRSLKDRPGRKTAVLFSAGVHVPPGSEHLVGALAGLASRFRVSFYGVDPRGVEMARPAIDVAGGTGEEEVTGWMHGHLEQTVGNVQARTDPRWQDPRTAAGAGGGPESALGTIAELTGGFVVPRTDSSSKGMRRIAEDLASYYELTYRPATAKADGSVRKLEIQVAREGARVQAGRDYLVGASAAPPVPEFEKPLLAALATTDTLPHDLEVWDRALHFAWDGKLLEHVLWVAVPLSQVTLAEDAPAGQFKGQVAVLARVKDAAGQVVAAFSQDFPLVGPLDQLSRARGQSIPFVRRLALAPGDYTLETAVRDAAGGKLTARRRTLHAPAPGDLVQSSVSLGDLKPAGPSSDPSDPFRVGAERLVPNLGQPIKAGGSPMTLHCVVYPVAGSKAPASATFTLLQGAEALMTQTATLPAADASGRISYGSALRVDMIPPGSYQMKVSVTQGASRTEESTPFTIVP